MAMSAAAVGAAGLFTGLFLSKYATIHHFMSGHHRLAYHFLILNSDTKLKDRLLLHRTQNLLKTLSPPPHHPPRTFNGLNPTSKARIPRRSRAPREVRQLLKGNWAMLSSQERKIATNLAAVGQGHLLKGWPSPGEHAH